MYPSQWDRIIVFPVYWKKLRKQSKNHYKQYLIRILKRRKKGEKTELHVTIVIQNRWPQFHVDSEKTVRDVITKHMTDNKLLVIHSTASEISCILQSLEVLDYWTKSLDEGKLVDKDWEMEFNPSK